MTKESKVLIALIIVCTLALAGFQFWLQTRTLTLNLRAAQALNKEVQGSSAEVNATLEKFLASPTASASASPKGKASPSATVKATATPVASPSAEATPEE